MNKGRANIDGVSSTFETQGPTWAERAHLGELDAVLSPGDTERRNLFLHGISLFGAKKALTLLRNKKAQNVVIDFGCGTGRFVRFFGRKGCSVIGVDITSEMLTEARKFGLPPLSEVSLTDGISIPADDGSVDMIWVCGVLKYSLFPPGSICRGGDGTLTKEPFVPVYHEIAKEMHRVLKPQGLVVNVEMYVDVQPKAFVVDFEQVGFITNQVYVLHRYGRIDKLCKSTWLPRKWVVLAGFLSAALRLWLDDPRRPVSGVRDYLFVWSKPKNDLC